jgi:hypothetical protein
MSIRRIRGEQMGKIHAFIVGVESYHDRGISGVRFAEADADLVANALKLHDLEDRNLVLLRSSSATKTQVEHNLRQALRRATADDLFFFFFAGHGVADAGRNVLLCHDTALADLWSTGISLRFVLELVRESACKRVVLLLDACHSGLEIDEGMRSLVSDMTDAEFEQFASEAEFHLAFASCKTDEKSYSTTKLKHGVWTHNLVQAIEGHDERALDRGRYVTASSLMNFLSKSIPETIQKIFVDKKIQTPISWGNLTRETILFDLKDVLEQRNSAASRAVGDVSKVSFVGTEFGNIRGLPGWKPGHRPPTAINDQTTSFVQSISEDMVPEAAEELLQSLRREFGYTRREAEVQKSPGSATITTKEFTVDYSIGIAKDNISKYVMRTELSQIANPTVLDTEAFADVFDNIFNRVKIQITGSLDVRAVIDQAEASKALGLSVKYPSDESSCTLEFADVGFTMGVTRKSITLRFPKKVAVETLLEGVKKVPLLARETPALRIQ